MSDIQWVYVEGDIVAFDSDGNSLGVVDLNQQAQVVATLLDERNELQAKVDRLVSRGIEDLRFENEKLRADNSELQSEVDRLKVDNRRFHADAPDETKWSGLVQSNSNLRVRLAKAENEIEMLDAEMWEIDWSGVIKHDSPALRRSVARHKAQLQKDSK